MTGAQVSTEQVEGKGYIGIRSDLVDVELKAIRESLSAINKHLEQWTPERIAEDQGKAHKALNLVHRVVNGIPERIDCVLDLISHVEDGEVCHD